MTTMCAESKKKIKKCNICGAPETIEPLIEVDGVFWCEDCWEDKCLDDGITPY